RYRYSQVLLSRLQRRTARAITRTLRDSGQELEIFGEGRPRTSELVEVCGRLPRAAGSYQYERGALVRDSSGSQVVRASARRRGDQRQSGSDGSEGTGVVADREAAPCHRQAAAGSINAAKP